MKTVNRPKRHRRGRALLFISLPGLAFAALTSPLYGQEAQPRYLKLENAAQVKAIQPQALGTFGTATIKMMIGKDGRQSGVPTLEPDADRRGPEDFDDRLIAIMRDWEYTPGFEGPIYITVAIPGPNEMEEGKIPSISVDLKYLQILDPHQATISRLKEHQLQLVKQEGFLDNVYLTGAPVAAVDAYEGKGALALMGEVWQHLGPVFQGIFLVLLGFYVFALFKTFQSWRRSWVEKGYRIGKDLFDSEDVEAVQRKWTQAIKHSQLGPELFERPYAIDLAAIKQSANAIADLQDWDAIKQKAEETGLVEVLGSDFLYTNNGNGNSGSLSQKKARFRQKLESEGRAEEWLQPRIKKIEQCRNEDELMALVSEEGYKIEQIFGPSQTHKREPAEIKAHVLQAAKTLEEIYNKVVVGAPDGNGSGNGMNDNDEAAMEDFLWKTLAKPKVKEALRICDRYQDVPVFDIFKSGLRNHLVNRNQWWASQEIDRSVDRTTQTKIEDRRGPLDWLWAIGSLSPMFGLFGTVWGISQAFGKIRGVTDTRLLMQKLAGDINIALATTIVGLILGVLAFITYYYAKYFLDRDAARVEKYFTDITNLA